jgi:Asp-tRNA(Asn)/Glu-tRNA(Gln) amidotransferase A subunit family amidase
MAYYLTISDAAALGAREVSATELVRHAIAVADQTDPHLHATGNPMLSVVIGLTGNGPPLGLQIAGRSHQDGSVLRSGDALQPQTGWHLRLPPAAAAAAVPPVGPAR